MSEDLGRRRQSGAEVFMRGAWLFAVMAVLAGCNEPCPAAEVPPALDSYSLACDVDEDCALVSRPDCGPCACAGTPLRAADTNRYVEEQTICCDEAVEAVCDGCLDVIPICNDSRCAAGPRN